MKIGKIMETDPQKTMDDRKTDELGEALKLWEEIRQVDQKRGWKRLEAGIKGKRSVHRRQIRLRYIRLAAAVVVLWLGIGGVFWFRSDSEPAVAPVLADRKQPRLILETGEQIGLGAEEGGERQVRTQNFVIDREEKSIIYVASPADKRERLQYNILEVPRGGEYELILADGTHVWLNADSRLRYPAHFGKKERRVYLEGEAYFQVAKDSACPFRVESVAQTVEVLGTEFNVSAYSDDEGVYTTLVEGRVAVTASRSGEYSVLRPGQQAWVNGQAITVNEVNIHQVVDWKNGMFVFDDQNLETILRKVVHWYDVEVFFRNQAARTIIFKGNLPRYRELPELLKVLESSSDVRFSLKGKSLTVE